MCIIVSNQADNLGGRKILIGNVSSQNLPYENSIAVDIRLTLILLSLEDLGSHPVWSSYSQSFLFAVAGSDPGKPEITKFDVPALIDQHVRTFQITV